MFYRQHLNTTLTDLRTLTGDREEGSNVVRIEPGTIQFHLESTDPSISFGEHEVAASADNMGKVGDLLQVPSGFLKRVTEKASAATINALFDDLVRNTVTKDLAVSLSATGGSVLEVEPWGEL